MELSTHEVKYSGPVIPQGMKSTVDEEDLDILIIGARENIYSYPERTLVQEYVNNGKDANREAGSPDHAMDIHIPTRDRPVFICRDYGTGLSPQDMETVYRKTAKSTKRNNNKLTGKYGLGSKIGFAYTDAFTVRSYFNGMRYTYLAHKANTKIGEFIQTEAIETTEPNGIEIEVALKTPDHISRFTDAIKRIFKYWPDKPKFNYNLAFPDFIYSDENIVVIQGSGTGILVDGTPYKVDLSDYNLTNSRETSRLIDRWGGDVYFKAELIDVEIPMNREHIENNDKVRDFFVKVPTKLKVAEDILVNAFKAREYNTFAEMGEAWNDKVLKLVKAETTYVAKKIGRTFELSSKGSVELVLKIEDSAVRIYDRESRNKFIVTRTIRTNCIHLETYVTSRLNKIFDKERSTTVFETPILPEGFKEFFQTKSYDEAFPKGSSSSSRGSSRSDPLDKETIHIKKGNSCDTSMKINKFKEEHPNLDQPIKYVPVINNSFDRDFVKTVNMLLKVDGYEGEVYGLSTRSATILTKCGYIMEEVPRDSFPITEKVKAAVRMCSFYVINETLWNVLSINAKKNKNCLDEDIAQIIRGRLAYDGTPDSSRLRNLAVEDHVPGLKDIYAQAEVETKVLRRKVIAKYPFLSFSSSYNNDYKGVNEWLFTSLIPLLFQQSTEQNKSLQETTVSA